MPTNPTAIHLKYAINVLLSSGAVVAHTDDAQPGTPWPWTVTPRGRQTPFLASDRAMVTLAHDEARRRRLDWQHHEDTLQMTLFRCEGTPDYEATA